MYYWCSPRIYAKATCAFHAISVRATAAKDLVMIVQLATNMTMRFPPLRQHSLREIAFVQLPWRRTRQDWSYTTDCFAPQPFLVLQWMFHAKGILRRMSDTTQQSLGPRYAHHLNEGATYLIACSWFMSASVKIRMIFVRQTVKEFAQERWNGKRTSQTLTALAQYCTPHRVTGADYVLGNALATAKEDAE